MNTIQFNKYYRYFGSEVFAGPGGFEKVSEACRIRILQRSSKSDFMASIGGAPKGQPIGGTGSKNPGGVLRSRDPYWLTLCGTTYTRFFE